MIQHAPLYQFKFTNGTTTIFLVASPRGLCGLLFKRDPNMKMISSPNESPILTKAVQELTKYFAGERKKFTVKLDIQGTDFQKKVWNTLLAIPYGQTVSYLEVARRMGKPQAVRAVGTAIGKNPICIFIPCHRVIASDGTIGGYSGGLTMKKKLLGLEAGTLISVSPSRRDTSP